MLPEMRSHIFKLVKCDRMNKRNKLRSVINNVGKSDRMLEINKNYVLDSNQNKIAVQIPIAEFEKMEEILEDYGLAQLMEEVEEDETLNKEEALKYLALLRL